MKLVSSNECKSLSLFFAVDAIKIHPKNYEYYISVTFLLKLIDKFVFGFPRRNLSSVQDREICCYSISCKEKANIDITLQWLIAHSKSQTR